MFDIQRTFAAGELSPAIHQRIDVDKVNTGLKTCRNFIVRKEGGVKYRHGTKYVCNVKDWTKNVRLVPFVFSSTISYVLEFGHNYIRFISNGTQITSGGSPYEVTTTYTQTEIEELDFEQSLDTITIVHRNHPPRNLVRFSDTNWTLSNIVFNPTSMFNSERNYPGVVTYYQQRRVFASTINKPETVWMSNVGVYTDFTTSSPVVASDKVEFTIAGRRYQKVNKLIEVGGKFLVLTQTGEWVVAGDGDGVVKPTAINVVAQSENGSTSPHPVVVNGTLVYEQQLGSAVYGAKYSFTANAVESNDLSVFSPHLLFGKTIKSVAYQRSYDSVVWLVRDDGILLGMTYYPDQDVWAWHRHDTNGTFEKIVVVPETTTDAAYVVVKRGSAKMIERIADPSDSTDVMDHWFVDCGAEYDGRNSTGSVNIANSASGWTTSDLITLTASSDTFSASDVGNAYKLEVGRQSVDINITEYVSTTVIKGYPNKTVPTIIQGVTTRSWTKKIKTVTGLSYLNGYTVSILADGSVEPQQVVSGGQLTLSRPFSRIVIGLPYVGQIKTLDIERGDQTLIANKKQIISVRLAVQASRGVKAGIDYNNLVELKQRVGETYGDPIALKTGVVSVNVPSSWSDSGEIVVQQDDPLPLTILAVSPEYRVSKV